jgi:hypothetical protein
MATETTPVTMVAFTSGDRVRLVKERLSSRTCSEAEETHDEAGSEARSVDDGEDDARVPKVPKVRAKVHRRERQRSERVVVPDRLVCPGKVGRLAVAERQAELESVVCLSQRARRATHPA